MRKHSNARPVLAGSAAILAMTVLYYPAFVYGIPMLDFATAFGAWLGEESLIPLGETWWLGLAEHLFNGAILFPLVYARLVAPLLPGGRLVRGLIWGTLLFAGFQFFVTPVLGLGFFSSLAPEPGLFRIVQLSALLFYGALFTALAGRPEAIAEADAFEEEPLRTAA